MRKDLALPAGAVTYLVVTQVALVERCRRWNQLDGIQRMLIIAFATCYLIVRANQGSR